MGKGEKEILKANWVIDLIESELRRLLKEAYETGLQDTWESLFNSWVNNTIDEQIYQLLHSKTKVISDLLQEKKLINTENQSVINEFLAKIKKIHE